MISNIALIEEMTKRGLQESIKADLRQRELRDKMVEREETRRKDLQLLNTKPMGNA